MKEVHDSHDMSEWIENGRRHFSGAPMSHRVCSGCGARQIRIGFTTTNLLEAGTLLRYPCPAAALTAALTAARAETARLREAASVAVKVWEAWSCAECGWIIGEGHPDNDPDDPEYEPCECCKESVAAWDDLRAALSSAATGGDIQPTGD